METKEVKIGDKVFKVRELLAVEFDSLPSSENLKERMLDIVSISCGLSKEEISQLTIKNRTLLLEAINDLNGWTADFRKSQEIKKSGTSIE